MYEVQTLGDFLPNIPKEFPGIPADWLPPGFVPPPGVKVIPSPQSPAPISSAVASAGPSTAVLVGGGVALVGLAVLGTWLFLRR